MPKTERIIGLCCRKIINATYTGVWKKLGLADTYREFLMQAQFFDRQKQHATFAQILQRVTGAGKPPFLVSSDAVVCLNQFNRTVQDVSIVLGHNFLPFKHYRLELLAPDVTDKIKHRVVVDFYTTGLRWHDTIGSHLLLSANEQEAQGE